MPYVKVIGKGVYREIEARTVYLFGSAVDALREWLRMRCDFLQDKDIETDAVFITRSAKRFTESDVRKMLQSCSGGEVTPHMVRHWYATVVGRVNQVLAQQNLGHKSINTTYSRYMNGAYEMKDILANM